MEARHESALVDHVVAVETPLSEVLQPQWRESLLPFSTNSREYVLSPDRLGQFGAALLRPKEVVHVVNAHTGARMLLLVSESVEGGRGVVEAVLELLELALD